MQSTVYRRRALPRWGRKRIARFVAGSYRNIAAGTISLASKTNTTVSLIATDATGGNQVYTYQWYRSTSPGFTPGIGNILSGKTALTLGDSGLVANTTYYYVIRYTDGNLASADASEFSVTTDYSGGASGSVFSSSVIVGGSMGVL
jgi:hypothetical protein